MTALSPGYAAKSITLVEDGPVFIMWRGTSYFNVCRTVQRFGEDNIYMRRPGSGRKKRTLKCNDRFIVMQVLCDRLTTVLEARHHLLQVGTACEHQRKDSEMEIVTTGPLHMREHCVAHPIETGPWSSGEEVLFTDE
ncbi:hypothetical protein ANN_09531 [Periplaneta americana]|uniref:Uncharacterized protein n=1 Tax=Periplaneta americana TaxID=6978 RepID=A0ABQ8TLW6_PERAM|nr:hypothetical protein ANN_09531 [Periplaneta americana]